uniref:Uncharacterized protein n=1 Tax=Arundo donax TaxID=35708 RepID=A0A0A9CF67_ARUDO
MIMQIPQRRAFQVLGGAVG